MQTSMSHSVLKPVLTLALWLTAAAGLSAEPVVATSKNEVSEILAADQAFAKSAIGDNVDLFASYMVDDFVLLELETATDKTPSHWVSTSKKDWVAAVRSRTQRYTAVEVHNQTVHLQGSIATVTGEYSQTAIKNGKDDSSTGSYVETWVKRNGRWLVLNAVFP
jgi:ketosteroid isomerase-like protein